MKGLLYKEVVSLLGLYRKNLVLVAVDKAFPLAVQLVKF